MRRILLSSLLCFPALISAQDKEPSWTDQEKPIVEQLRGLRKIPDDTRPAVTERLALEIRKLPASPSRLSLAEDLAYLSTEGDAGPRALQEVATTLEASIGKDVDKDAYLELANLVRYEHVRISVKNPQFDAAMSTLEAADRKRETADFTLSDLNGKTWTLHELRGKVVFVNFWATWCPPCRKEMPDMEALHQEFEKQGLVVLAISDEEPDKVKPFLADKKYTYPILLDPGRKVAELFAVQGIPKSFVYNREGHLIAEAMDGRTRRQFLEMLAQAGIRPVH